MAFGSKNDSKNKQAAETGVENVEGENTPRSAAAGSTVAAKDDASLAPADHQRAADAKNSPNPAPKSKQVKLTKELTLTSGVPIRVAGEIEQFGFRAKTAAGVETFYPMAQIASIRDLTEEEMKAMETTTPRYMDDTVPDSELDQVEFQLRKQRQHQFTPAPTVHLAPRSPSEKQHAAQNSAR